MSIMNRLAFLLILITAAFAATASAHDVPIARVNVELADGGAFEMSMRFDAASYIFGEHVEPALAERILATPIEKIEEGIKLAREDFQRHLELWFDGERVQPNEVEFPSVQAALAAIRRSPPALLTVIVKVHVPPEAQQFQVVFPEELVHASVTVLRDGEPLMTALVRAGQRSEPFPVSSQPAEQEQPTSKVTSVPVAAPGFWKTAWQYLVLGFEHIMPPDGWDHILFVLGLFLLSVRMRPLLWQVTAFTAAHTFTLALAVTGMVQIPAQIVEPLIALSIVYVAVENIFTSKLKPWRPVVVFAFGLLHGLGFGRMLIELGLPRGQFTTALLSFTVGVEVGQLAVIAAALLVVGWWRHRVWYRSAVIIPASCCIALIGLYWTVERVM